jgi:hypothetical protein
MSAPHGQPAPEDHPVLDIIANRLRHRSDYWQASRQSECVEFRDPDSGQWYEIVVRAIDEPSDEDAATERGGVA